jgi:hypothetical protein
VTNQKSLSSGERHVVLGAQKKRCRPYGANGFGLRFL